MKHLISINDLQKQDILDILALTHKFKQGLRKKTLEDKIIASCFFENSTRTRLSFDAAIIKLGGRTIGFADSSSTSMATKGESFNDTIKVISAYADALIIRHPLDGSARLASEIANIPTINAGDGANQHPTQTLIDLFSIQESQGDLNDIHLGVMGDLKFSRTSHSLIEVSKFFNMHLYLIAPASLRIMDEQLLMLKQNSIQYSFHESLDEVIHKLDCLYFTRLQKERHFDIDFNGTYSHIKPEILHQAKPNFKILCPLPRLDELPTIIDTTPFAYYFQQAHNGLYVRQALLDIMFSQ